MHICVRNDPYCPSESPLHLCRFGALPAYGKENAGRGTGGGIEAIVGFSVRSRRRQLADRHLRCPSLPLPCLE